jgi:hypothetical protein
MAGLSVFLDTMVYLHFVPFDQIDFAAIVDAELVTIVVPRVTFKELEKHKINHASARTRERARQALVLLEKCIESGSPVRDGVSIAFIPRLPRLDMEQYGLNPLWNDDVLIASVVEYRSDNPSEETILVTDDTGARLTCRHLGVKTIRPPEKYRLAPELDDDEKETRRLRRELEKLQHALPKLAIGFVDGMELVRHFSLRPPEPVNESVIAKTLAQLKRALPEHTLKKASASADDPMLSGLAQMFTVTDAFGGIPDEEVRRYNEERLTYFDEYAQYMRATASLKNRLARTLRFTIAISNTGTAPAEDVDLRLYFPDGFSLCAEDELPAAPKEPSQPTMPRSQMEMLSASVVMPGFRMPELYLPDVGPPSSFRLRKTNSYEVSDHFDRIKHGQTEALRQLFLMYDSHEAAASFHCNYEISVGNLPVVLTGSLHFVIEKEETSSKSPVA